MVDLYDIKSGRKIEVASGPSGVDGGGGGPHDPYMEARVQTLENAVADIKSVLGRLEPAITKIRDDTSEIKGKIAHMPTMLQIGTVVLAINAGIVGVSVLLIAALRGTGH